MEKSLAKMIKKDEDKRKIYQFFWFFLQVTHSSCSKKRVLFRPWLTPALRRMESSIYVFPVLLSRTSQ